MMPNRPIACWIMSLLMAVIMTGCTSTTDNANPIPRRKAYPRINLYGTTYRTESVDGLELKINSGAIISITDSTTNRNGCWFNITYPRYNATIHCTLTNTDKNGIEKILDNRAERMALNTGGAYTEVTDFEPTLPTGFTAQLLVTPAESAIPVQFLASNGINTVMSGSMTFNKNGQLNADSIAPIITAVKADMTELLKSLSIK